MPVVLQGLYEIVMMFGLLGRNPAGDVKPGSHCTQLNWKRS